MKVKLKFDMDTVKEFGKEHGEKFGLAFAVLIMGMFIVKAASRDHLPDKYQPDKIKDKSDEAQKKITSLKTPPAAQDVGYVDFVSLVSKEPAHAPPMNIRAISQEPFPDPVKRVDPTYFAIEDVRVTPFRGGLVLAVGPAAGQGGGNVAAPAAGPAAGGLAPGRAAPARAGGLRPGAGAQVRPALGAPAGGLAGGGLQNGAAQGPIPFPADFKVPGPPSTGFAEGRYGIVVTALIPDGAQREEYERRFKNARRGVMVEGANGAERGRGHAEIEADSPQYVWCWLERTDTTEGKPPIVLNFGDVDQIRHDYQQTDKTLLEKTKAQIGELGINKIVQNRLDAAELLWGGTGGEVVDKDYLMEKCFSWHLPPILLRNWGAEAAHPPQVPLALAPAIAAPAGGAAVGAPALGDFSDPDKTGPARRHEPGGIGAKTQAAIDVPYKLFRFVDLEVEPGHAYQYRVRMMLRNPNFGLEAQVLLKPETAMVPYRQTPWSAMSPAAFIPRNTRLLGGSIKHPRPHERAEPEAKISVFTFDPLQAIELIKEFDTELGVLVSTTVAINATAPDHILKNVADPVKREIRDITGDFHTGSVLLDFRGNDEKLPGAGGLTDPAEMLLLDDVDHPDNPRLIVVNEAKDKPIIDEWKKTHIPPASANAAPGAVAPAKAGGLAPGGLSPPAGSKTPTPRRPAGR
jgi:hypothetical protein